MLLYKAPRYKGNRYISRAVLLPQQQFNQLLQVMLEGHVTRVSRTTDLYWCLWRNFRTSQWLNCAFSTTCSNHLTAATTKYFPFYLSINDWRCCKGNTQKCRSRKISLRIGLVMLHHLGFLLAFALEHYWNAIENPSWKQLALTTSKPCYDQRQVFIYYLMFI